MRADSARQGRGTPELERFLARSTLFSKARTTVPLTLPAHVSLFTGLSPRRTLVHDNVAPPLVPRRGFPLLAEEFSSEGYATAAFPAASVVGTHTGLTAGFDHYERVEAPADVRLDPENEYGEVPAERSADRALGWLAGRPKDRPFFLWLHFYDPHDPYHPWPGDGQRPGTRAEDTDGVRYLGEIRRVDAALERVLAAVPADTIVVLLSDHGEALGEHGERTHGALCYSCTSDIFLAVRAPGLAPGAVRAEPRSICDVAPSLRAWCGLESRESDGTRLDEPPAHLPVTESLYFWRLHGWGQSFSVTDGLASLVESGSAVEVFDLRADPAESSPRRTADEARYEALDRILHGYRSAPAVASAAPEVSVSSPYGSLRRPVSSYLTRAENARLPDPREKLALASRIADAADSAAAAMRRGDVPRLAGYAKEIEEIAGRDPTTPVPFYDLVYVCGKLGDMTGDAGWHRKAAAAARSAIARGFNQAPVLFDLVGQSLLGGAVGDLREAVGILEEQPRCADPKVREIVDRLRKELESRGEADLARRAGALLAR